MKAPKSKTYRNRIDALLGITVSDLEDIRKRSRPYQQRQRQVRRWAAHKARKAAT
jgi:hypothetical protein